MNIRKPKPKTGLEDAIEDVLRELKGHDATSPEYAKAVDQIVKLHTLTQTEKRDRLSKDTMAAVAANLLGILVIVGYEQRHTVTSKGLSFIHKLM